MNQFLDELKAMKTMDFWNNFLSQTTKETTKTSEMSSAFEDFEDSRRVSPKVSSKVSFSSSAFFDPKSHPSIKDQVFMCRRIAKQLVCDESNAKSKGREMFEKRVQKSSHWVTTDETTDETTEQMDFHETTISEGEPNLRLLLDGRHVQDLNSVLESNEIAIIRERDGDDKCRQQSKAVVHDLTSPEVLKNKGNILFAKRREESEEWDVKEEMKEEEPIIHVVNPIIINPFNPLIRFRDFNARAKPFIRLL